ncbi:MAG: Si-specific NAD(P)(+) transhydrogenase [Abitibacteriaceae bacterium]|nr:Si-specific NAD(P)(+) transhydrogenase [Abditibacteriaceae bacterium]
MKSYDLIVIGSGPAGEQAASLAAFFGKSVAIIEREVVPGGTCTNTGTIPSKTLRESALILSGVKQRGMHNVDMSLRPNITVSDFMYRKREVVEKEWDLIEDNLRAHNVDRYRGIARFGAPHAVIVDTSGYDEVLEGDVILIATGSRPHRPSTIPFDDNCICDSDSILNIDRIPRTLAVVGAGVIGCEYASIFAALGVEVTLIDGRTELLGNIDREIVDMLMRQMRNRWRIQLQLGQGVDSITVDGEQTLLKLKNGRELKPDKVLYAAGRQSNTDELDLNTVGVKTGERGIIAVNDNFQTNVPYIYAAGDVIGFPALASTSMEQGRSAVVHAFDLDYKAKLASLLPYGIYTIPEISMIGLTEEDCLKRDMNYEVGRAYYRNNARGQIIGDTAGMIKIVFNPDDHKLIGVHLIGENASDLIHVGMITMQLGGTLETFIHSVFNYPTLGDIYKYAAYDGLNRLKRVQSRRKDDRPNVTSNGDKVNGVVNGASADGKAADGGAATSVDTPTAANVAMAQNAPVQPAQPKA